MYRIYYGDYLLYDLRVPEEEGYYLKNPKLIEEINKVSELSFDIYATHPNFDKLEKLVPSIVLEKNNKAIFKGRVITEKQNMDKSKQVTCESVLAFLFDSCQRPFEFQGSPADLFVQFINNHNEQVEEYKQFKIGKLTGANLDNNEYISRSSDGYLNTFESIEGKILNIGGYIYVTYEEDGNYINWVDDFADENGQYASTQTIEFGENLIDITVENNGADIYSVIIPLGAEIEQEDGTTKRLDIKEINDGLDYLVNEEALAKYGWIVAPIDQTTWDDVTVADNLKTKARKLLDNEGVKFKSTLELNAIDLNVVDGDIEAFEMGEYVKVQSTPHNLSRLYLLNKKETPLSNPENMMITLGETKSTLTGIQLGESEGIKNQINTIIKDYKINEEDKNSQFDSIREEIQNNTSLINQTADEIKLEVSEEYVSTGTFNEYKEQTSTQLTQTSEDWNFQFNQIVQQITNVDGTVNNNYNELVKYIRLKDGTITLGVVDNPLILTLANDRMSFIHNGTEVAYISEKRLFITDVEVTKSLRIGKFAFIPRENGSLDFKKVG